MPTLVIDVDNTLAYSRRRDHLEGRWDEYNADSINDRPVPETVAMVRSLSEAGWRILALTAMPERWRSLRLRWLVEHDVPVDFLFMRPDDCFDRAPKFKVKFLREYADNYDGMIVVMDDRTDVVEAVRDAGFTVHHVRVGRQ